METQTQYVATGAGNVGVWDKPSIAVQCCREAALEGPPEEEEAVKAALWRVEMSRGREREKEKLTDLCLYVPVRAEELERGDQIYCGEFARVRSVEHEPIFKITIPGRGIKIKDIPTRPDMKFGVFPSGDHQNYITWEDFDGHR